MVNDFHAGYGGAGDGSSGWEPDPDFEAYLEEKEIYGKHGLARDALCALNKHVPSRYHLDLACKYCGESYGSYEDRLKLERKEKK